ncbi:CoA-dependent acyltransferase, partial [Periconia macrospinosa]
LQSIWCPILGLPAGRIGIRDNFLRLGGDSLKAIALVHAARRAWLQLSVADIFLHPVLSEMAEFVRDSSATLIRDQGAEVARTQEEGKKISTLSMLNDGIDAIKSHASYQCCITVDDVEDIYPCTAMQVGMVVASSMTNLEDGDQAAGLYVLRRRIIFESPSAAMNFSTAWEVVRRRMPILRTRIIQYQSTFYQVVVKSDAAPIYNPPGSVADFYGRPLAELKVGPDNECEISLHHSIYDAVLLPRLLEDIRREYVQFSSGPTTPSQPPRMIPFRDFIQYLQSCDEKAASSFW